MREVRLRLQMTQEEVAAQLGTDSGAVRAMNVVCANSRCSNCSRSHE